MGGATRPLPVFIMEQTLQSIKGVGEKRAEQLGRLGIHGVDELLGYFPRDYCDFSRSRPVCELADGMVCAVNVRIQTEPVFFRTSGMTVLSVRACDETGTVMLKWFNQPYRRAQVRAGKHVYACGRVQNKNGLTLLNPAFSDTLPGVLPVYPTVKGVPQRTIRDAVSAALKRAWDAINETLPPELIGKYGLCTRQLALRQIHFPSSMELMQVARRRIGFEQMLLYLLAVEHLKAQRARSAGVAFDTKGIQDAFLNKLSFSPTGAQLRVMDELARDMQAARPMNRLLQGDVGSGKTAVALYALTVAAANGYQGAFMAPTEILAVQHYEQARAIFGESAVLLNGSMKKTERDAAQKRVAEGSALCVVGTHALLQQGVRFHRLGVVVTDEQHRFGVQQRAQIQEKGTRPDVLVMSATPIPRTLALLLYGDLDVSILDELPPGRKPVKTRVIPQNKRADMYRYIGEQAALGAQAYVVCPLIEPSEALEIPSVESVYAELMHRLPGVRISVLHGRMGERDKQGAVAAFRAGAVDVLVTTTVIEVGVHVENACIMVIEGAERFGLSQLHQLRGRVGRGARQAYCFLLTQSDADTAEKRMQALTKTSDGFEIAQRDLQLRGPGDFFGTRQHGESQASPASDAIDLDLLAQAKRAAEEIMAMPGERNNALIAHALMQCTALFERITMN